MMQFDWTTFILEILNFLVLVWILQRLFYRPILALLDARQQKIKDDIANAQTLAEQGQALRQQYELRLQEWAQERESLLRNTEVELAQLRNNALENLKQTLVDEAAKQQLRNQALSVAHESTLRRNAADAAFAQVTVLLERLASPQLTNRITTIFLDDLAKLSQTEQAALQKAAQIAVAPTAPEIISAHSLDDNTRLALSQGLSLACGQTLQFIFKEQSELLAGLRVVIGDCQLDANLANELVFFTSQAIHD